MYSASFVLYEARVTVTSTDTCLEATVPKSKILKAKSNDTEDLANMDGQIQVVVRLRPMSEREQKGNALPVVTASTEKKEVTVIKGAGTRTLRSTFKFDNVFTSFSTQKEVSVGPFPNPASLFCRFARVVTVLIHVTKILTLFLYNKRCSTKPSHR